jgi:hypothetical protein
MSDFDQQKQQQEKSEQCFKRAAELNPQPLSSLAAVTTQRIWFWDCVLTTGLGVIAAKKGCYKSWLSLQLAYAVAQGRPFLEKTTRKAPVLYMALELDNIAMAERCRKLGTAPDGLDVLFSFTRGLAALNDLEALLAAKAYRFVIVDMLPAILPKGTDGNSYDAITEFMLSLRRLAQSYSSCFLCLLHSGKAERADFVDSVLGSTGFAGQADTVIVLDRKRGDTIVKFMSSGNHGRDCCMKIEVGENMIMKRIEDDDSDGNFLPQSAEQVYTLLKDNYPQGTTAAVLSGVIGKSADAVRKILTRQLVDRGLVEQASRGIYKITNGQSDTNGQSVMSGQCPF